jgi:hypothetical protein
VWLLGYLMRVRCMRMARDCLDHTVANHVIGCISGALRELSVALCRGNASLCRSGAYVATCAAGRAPMRGLAQPSAEVV